MKAEKLHIIKEFRNNLLKRKEIIVVEHYEKNPGYAAVGKQFADHFKTSEENVVVRKIDSNFGKDKFLVDLFIYDTPELKKEIETQKKEKKKVGG